MKILLFLIGLLLLILNIALFLRAQINNDTDGLIIHGVWTIVCFIITLGGR